jgi:hypothetical protein
MFGWGLHYGTGEPSFVEDMEHFFGAMQRTHEASSKLWFWLGAPKQHFRYDENPLVDGGWRWVSRKPPQWCGPAARFNYSHPMFDNRTARFFERTREKNVSAGWINWSLYENECQRLRQRYQHGVHIHVFPSVALTAPFYKNHRAYNSSKKVWQDDCTHSCWAPNLYEPYWDALYLAMNLRSCDQKPDRLYPAGARNVTDLDTFARRVVDRMPAIAPRGTFSLVNALHDKIAAIASG